MASIWKSETSGTGGCTSLIVYNSAISACEKSNRWQEAFMPLGSFWMLLVYDGQQFKIFAVVCDWGATSCDRLMKQLLCLEEFVADACWILIVLFPIIVFGICKNIQVKKSWKSPVSIGKDPPKLVRSLFTRYWTITHSKTWSMSWGCNHLQFIDECMCWSVSVAFGCMCLSRSLGQRFAANLDAWWKLVGKVILGLCGSLLCKVRPWVWINHSGFPTNRLSLSAAHPEKIMQGFPTTLSAVRMRRMVNGRQHSQCWRSLTVVVGRCEQCQGCYSDRHDKKHRKTKNYTQIWHTSTAFAFWISLDSHFATARLWFPRFAGHWASTSAKGCDFLQCNHQCLWESNSVGRSSGPAGWDHLILCQTGNMFLELSRLTVQRLSF